ncbi:MAG: hypothetical protein K5663_11320 [Clostridiales bacterium]|nr:hypothetical protein [Clostridiales bacterium]
MFKIATDRRIDWNAIRAEYIGGASYGRLAKKYGVCKSTIYAHSKQDDWQKLRADVANETRIKTIQKTAQKAADNATLAADIKRKGLLILSRLFDKYLDVEATERASFDHDDEGNYQRDVLKLRDLTQAYKDLTEDMRGDGAADNDRPVIVDARPEEGDQ